MSQFTGISSVTGLGSIETDVIPAAVNWTDITSIVSDLDSGRYSSQQITGIKGSIIITANWTFNGGANFGLSCEVSNTGPGPIQGFITFTSLISGQPISVANNQWLTFRYGSESTGVTVTVRNASDSNTILDTFVCNHSSSPCLLTTTIVGYFGLSDNGPELTAMRVLRDHYAEVGGYTEIIQDYYTNSPRIIEAIVAANSESVEYSYIHNTVLAVKQHIDLGELQQAHDLYMAMYAQLKTKYLEN
jgi:hypothetical protein